NGGPQLAAFTALYSLYERGIIQATNSAITDGDAVHLDARQFAMLSRATGLEAVAPLPQDAHPIQRSAYQLVNGKPGTRPSDLLHHVERRPAMRLLADDMVRRGLVRSTERRLKIRLTALWFVPLIVLGVVRANAGANNGKPIEFLLVLLTLAV